MRLLRADAPDADPRAAGWKLATRLSHPHLVRVFDTGLWHADEEFDLHFAVMEYCEESLAEVLRVRPLTADEARIMLFPTLDALQYLHAQGVVHGHLSPAAILAQGDQLKLSTVELRRNGEAHRAATPSAYDPPEKTAASFSGDLWSLGVTLCEALTRQLPARDQHGLPQAPANLPAPFDQIVQPCLAVNRESRVSIDGIRKLLERTVPEVAPKPEPAAKTAPADVVMLRPVSSKPVAEVSPEEAPAQSRFQRRYVLAGAAAVVVLLAILIGLRTTKSPAPAATSNVPASTSATPAPRHPATASVPNRPGSVLQQVMPNIDAKARGTIRGTVKLKLRVQVDAHGRVTDASLASKSESTYFVTRSLEAARHWTFTAPVRNGQPQPSEWTVHFEFRRSGTRASAQMSSAG
jgi:TonB family protein